MNNFILKLPSDVIEDKTFYLSSVIHDSVSYTNDRKDAQVFTDSPEDLYEFEMIKYQLACWAIEIEVEHLEPEL